MLCLDNHLMRFCQSELYNLPFVAYCLKIWFFIQRQDKYILSLIDFALVTRNNDLTFLVFLLRADQAVDFLHSDSKLEERETVYK